MGLCHSTGRRGDLFDCGAYDSSHIDAFETRTHRKQTSMRSPPGSRSRNASVASSVGEFDLNAPPVLAPPRFSRCVILYSGLWQRSPWLRRQVNGPAAAGDLPAGVHQFDWDLEHNPEKVPTSTSPPPHQPTYGPSGTPKGPGPRGRGLTHHLI